MRARTRNLLIAAAALGGAVALERQAERRFADRVRGAADDVLDPLYVLPEDVTHHDVPTHDGGSIHLIEQGRGPTLLLLHGVTLQAEVWAPQMRLLSDRFRVIAMDVRAHGRSVVGTEGIGRRLAAHDLATVLDALDLRDVVVVGHSMGGMIIGEFCETYPETLHDRVAGLVFVSTLGSQPIPAAMMPAVKAAGARIERRLENDRWVPRIMAENDRSLLLSRGAFGRSPSGVAVEQVRRYGSAVDHRYYIPLWVDLFDYDGEAALDTVDLPALVLVGSRDTVTPVAAARRLASHLKRGELHIVAGAGHQLMQERPREVSDFVADFATTLATE